MNASNGPEPPAQKDALPIANVVARFAWPAAFVLALGMTFSYLRSRDDAERTADTTRVEHASPTILKELRDLGRLETTSLHVEKVVDVKDHQKRLLGLVDATDNMLFVASGEVVLGVDLARMRDEDSTFDPTTRTATIILPPPEILSSRFDELRSYVHARETDVLAKRNEGLEAYARREALASFEAAGREETNVVRAKQQAERQLRALAKAWGVHELVVKWRDESHVPERPAL